MKRLTALLLLLALVTTAWADEEKGLYVGAGVGQSNVQADDIADIGAVVTESRSPAQSPGCQGVQLSAEVLGRFPMYELSRGARPSKRSRAK